MNLATVVNLLGSGTSDGARKGWDTRGRGRLSAETVFGCKFQDLPTAVLQVGDKVLSEPHKQIVRVADLYPTQPFIWQKGIDKNTSSNAGKIPLVIADKGKLLIADGHHRVAAAIQSGDTSLEVNVVKVDEQKYKSMIKAVGTSEGVKKSWETRGRKPQGSPSSVKLTGTEAFKNPANKSFIVTTGGKVYGTVVPQGHDTMMVFFQPHLKSDLRRSAVEKFVEAGGIRAGIAEQGHAYVEINKATPDVLKRLVQTVEHLPADEIELEVGNSFYTGTKDKVLNAVRGVLESNVAASSMFANYALDRRTTFQGLQISIENDKGSTRKGVGKDGKPWSVTMTVPYGYIRKTEGVDGDHVDCFLGPNEQAVNAYVIHTTESTTGDYDEDKVMLGWDSADAAKKAFFANYSSKKFFGSIDTIPMDKFKEKVLATKQNPKKIAAQSKLETVLSLYAATPESKTISVGDQVTVDGLPGRGTAIMITSGRVYVRYRNGFEVSRAPNFVHVISGRMVEAESEMDESLTIKKNRPKSDWFNVRPGNKCGKQPASAALIKGYGTSEGVSKAWDTRGRGQKLIMGDSTPPKDKPVTLVFGGSFNPPHIGHSQTAEAAAQLLRSEGYNVAKIVIAPTANRLLKAKLGDRMYPLAERTELAKRTFPSHMEVSPKPAEEAETTEGKLRRTQLADSVQSLHPDNTVVNVTGEDAAPGHPPGYPSLYEGEGNHKGYYYLAIARPPDSLSSSQIRQQLLEGKPVKGMTPEAEVYLHSYLSRKSVHSSVRAYGTSEGVKKSWDTRGRGRHIAEELRQALKEVAFEKDQRERIKAVLEKEANDPKVKAAIALNEKLGDSRNFPGVLINGHYSPEADAENQKIAESFIHSDALPKPGEPPVAVFMLGKTGAGKSTLVKNMAGQMPPTVMINSDDVKERIKGYRPEAAQPYHERSCDIARNYLEPMAVKGGYNLTFDMTDNQDRLVKTIERLKDSGYKIALLMAHVDDATSAERAYARFQTKGRYVPLKVALSYGTKPQEAYQKVRDSGLADEWRAYDTSKKGEPIPLDSGTKDETWSVFKHRSLGGVGASRTRRSGAWSGGTKGWKGWKEKEVSGIGEPDVPMTGGHISPIPTFHPPSLRNPRLVPQPNDPKETDDRYLDVTKRKEAYQQRLKMLRRAAPGGLPAMMPAGTTGLAQHMGVAPSVYSSADKKVKQRPARQRGINRTFLR